MEPQIKNVHSIHEKELLQLYKKVVGVSDGIIRNKEEIDDTYISDFLDKSSRKGLILIATIDENIIGEIHAYTPEIYAFQHILTDLTIVVDPMHQGKGVGRKLFEKFLNVVTTNLTHIKRIELYTREHNTRNIQFYESLGFINEGRQRDKIYVSESTFETPIHMAWFNPNYQD